MEYESHINEDSYENDENPTNEYYLSFFGEGSRYVGIVIVNVVLTILTLGLYYPWAKAKIRQYLWNETELDNSRFVFHGTGKEMFRGFIIAYGMVFMLWLFMMLGARFGLAALSMSIFYIGLLILVPFALYGGWRYRVSRTSWRGIFMSFDGEFRPFLKLYFKDLFLTVITFGIYFAWMRCHIQKYLFSHTKLGHLRLDFHGEGGELFGINIVGYILMYPTLFLYVPAWLRQRFNFTINNTSLSDGDYRQKFESNLSAGETYKILITNFLLLIVTLGLAFPWTMMRSMRMYFNSIDLPEIFDLDNLVQEADPYTDATGDDLMDIFDIGLEF